MFNMNSSRIYDQIDLPPPPLQQPPPHLINHPPLPALKPGVPQHSSSISHNLRQQHDLYTTSQLHTGVESDAFLTADGFDQSDLGGQSHNSPLQLTQSDFHHRLPPPPILQQQQPLPSSSASLDPYQDYFQPPISRPYSIYDQNELRNSTSYMPASVSGGGGGSYHDFSGRLGANDPTTASNDYYFSSSTPISGSNAANQISQYRSGYEEDEQNFQHQYHQHFQPSPAVLLHIRYVMDSIVNSMLFTDVVIVTSSEKIRSHRAILASHSTFMRQLLIADLDHMGETEDPTLVIKEMSSAHLKLMMQFFYTGEVSLSSKADIQPLKEVCLMLGVSSLMARLEELSFSLQCLPNYDEDSFRKSQEDIIIQSSVPHNPPPPCEDLNTSRETSFSNNGNNLDMAVVDSVHVVDQQLPKLTKNSTETSGADEPINNIMPDVVTQEFDTSLLNDDGGGMVEPVVEKPVEAGVPPLKKKVFNCSKCDATFFNQEGLTGHERVHEGKKPFACTYNQCNSDFSSKNHLQTHMRKHAGKKPFSCQVCKKSFADMSSFKRHVASHSEKKGFNCKSCNKTYSDRSTYKRHQREKHGDSEAKKRFSCSLCKKCFKRKEILGTHVMRIHCKKIDKSLTKAQVVEKYLIKLETNPELKEKKNWAAVNCPQCPMIFYKKSTMLVHLRSHSGEKPYQCLVCNKKFARSNNLKLHSRVHTGEKPHHCTFDPESCSKSFSDVSALKRHLRTHTGEKPYSCQKCGRAFSQVGTTKSHEKNCKNKTLPFSASAENNLLNKFPLVASQDNKRYMNIIPHSRSSHLNTDTMVSSMMEDNSLSVMAGSEPPVFSTDTLDSVRASCM